MNIIVKTFEGQIIVRPDTTWEKDNEDLYPQEFIDSLSYTPILFARISKPGRSIGAKFAARYYDSYNYGVLLYPENMLDGSEQAFSAASCIDHTSFLPTPLYQLVSLGYEGNVFELNADGKKLFSFDKGSAEMIEQALVEASSRIYVRTGDMIAIELQDRRHLVSKSDSRIRISGTYCENTLLDFNIIMK